MRALIFLLFSLFCTNEILSQDPGIRAYSGITSATNRVLAVTPTGTTHKGFHFGADGRINSGKMFFVIGLRYATIDLIASTNAEFLKVENKHNIFSGRFGFGWHLIEFGPSMSIRGKILGQMDLHSGYDTKLLIAPYSAMVDASAGLTLGIGLELKFITLDVEYEYGLVNVYSKQKETKMDVLSLSLGFFF